MRWQGQSEGWSSQNDEGRSGFRKSRLGVPIEVSGERGALRLYLGIPKRRIGWSSGKAAGKTPGGLVLC
jgi:hypothetical protein